MEIGQFYTTGVKELQPGDVVERVVSSWEKHGRGRFLVDAVKGQTVVLIFLGWVPDITDPVRGMS